MVITTSPTRRARRMPSTTFNWRYYRLRRLLRRWPVSIGDVRRYLVSLGGVVARSRTGIGRLVGGVRDLTLLRAASGSGTVLGLTLSRASSRLSGSRGLPSHRESCCSATLTAQGGVRIGWRTGGTD